MNFENEFVTTQTDDIIISACQAYLEDESDDACSYYLRIENNSDDKIQILSKDFSITDDKGNSHLENGLGFKGEIPELEPGEYFEFADTMPIKSAFAVLYGTCRIVKEKCNQVKDIKIPAVSLIGNMQYQSSFN